MTKRPASGAVLYDGVEPIDVAGAIGVASTPTRVLPAIEAVTIANAAAPVALAGGLTVVGRHGSADAPPAGERRSRMPLCSPSPVGLDPLRVASVCTGALILAGLLHGRSAAKRCHGVP